MKRNILTLGVVITSLLFSAVPAFAHVVVKPNQAGVAAFQTFTIGVPNEKDMPVIGLRLVIPEGLNYVSPNVKPGWTIKVTKSGEGEEAKVTEISWTGGSIPAGQRDDFLFSAQVPADETTLMWKAYQTYQDGTIVSWDQDPETMKNLSDEQKEENEKKGMGPYSLTKVVNDLNSQTTTTAGQTGTNPKFTMLVSLAALALGAASLSMHMMKKK